MNPPIIIDGFKTLACIPKHSYGSLNEALEEADGLITDFSDVFASVFCSPIHTLQAKYDPINNRELTLIAFSSNCCESPSWDMFIDKSNGLFWYKHTQSSLSGTTTVFWEGPLKIKCEQPYLVRFIKHQDCITIKDDKPIRVKSRGFGLDGL
ncbi:MAG: hypothetical protein GXP43_01965 [bacterium]|nr:hypothetical protein [bacterium]